ncbi:hypothetical protein BC940DRAFT_290702 [Gongronella butleri]|nr:hypothetical protein BC940DRAFT_290702 [Gongronella butleri]
MTTQDAQHEIKAEPASARSPVAPMPSSTTPTMTTEAAPVVAVNKQVSSLMEEEDDSRTPTPKLSDVSDADPDAMLDDDDDDDKSNDLNDASQHPAYAPHVHPRLTDDEQIDSLATSEQTSTVATPQTDSFAPSAASSQPPLGHSQTGQIDHNEQIDPIDQNEQSEQNDQDPPSPVASQMHHHHVDPVAAPAPAAPVEQAAPSPPEPEIAAIAQPAPEQPLQPIPTTATPTTDTDVPMAESQNEHQPTP